MTPTLSNSSLLSLHSFDKPITVDSLKILLVATYFQVKSVLCTKTLPIMLALCLMLFAILLCSKLCSNWLKPTQQDVDRIQGWMQSNSQNIHMVICTFQEIPFKLFN